MSSWNDSGQGEGSGTPPPPRPTYAPGVGGPIPPPPGLTPPPGKNRRRFLIGAGAGAVVVAGGLGTWLATRGGDGKPAAAASPTPSATAPAAPPPAPPRPAYKIGVQGGVTGENAPLGVNVDRGVKLAVAQAQQRGTLPFDLSVVTSDDESSETRAVSAARILIGDPQVLAVVGPVFSGPARACQPVYAAAGLAAVSVSATNPTLTEGAGEDTTFFQAVPDDKAQGKAIGIYLTDFLHAGNVHLVDDKSQYGAGLIADVKAHLDKAGVSVTSHSVAARSGEFSAAVQAIKSTNAGAVVYGGYYDDTAVFAKSLASVGYTGYRISGDGTADEMFLKTAGADAEGWRVTTPTSDAAADPALKAFAADYAKEFSTAPTNYSAEAYDAACLIIEQLRGTQDREGVVKALRGTEYKGLTRTFKFTGQGRLEGQSMSLYEVKDGKLAYQGKVG